MEPGDTSGMALWHPATGQWSQRVIDAIDPDLVNKLPEVRPADASIGTVSADLAERFGLSPECKVDAGSGDNMYGAVGTGNVREGIVTVSLGTSGTAACCLEEPFVGVTPGTPGNLNDERSRAGGVDGIFVDFLAEVAAE